MQSPQCMRPQQVRARLAAPATAAGAVASTQWTHMRTLMISGPFSSCLSLSVREARALTGSRDDLQRGRASRGARRDLNWACMTRGCCWNGAGTPGGG